jgi:hypothetical protein
MRDAFYACVEVVSCCMSCIWHLGVARSQHLQMDFPLRTVNATYRWYYTPSTPNTEREDEPGIGIATDLFFCSVSLFGLKKHRTNRSGQSELSLRTLRR